MFGVHRIGLRIALLLALLPAAASGSEPQPASPASACPPQAFRWLEDCHAPAVKTSELRGIDRLRYVPLSTEGSVWLTFGGEYRLRSEHIADPAFGLRATPDFTATGHRALFHADWRSLNGPRLFVQLSAAAEEGRKPLERGFDASAVDLAQAFVDLPLGGSSRFATLRIGRQELNLFGNRLVGTRDAASLRRAFDAIELDLTLPGARVLLFGGHPVRNRQGAFDDAATPGERLFGASVRAVLNRPETIPQGTTPRTLDVFLFDRQRPAALYQDVRGPERRRTLGARLSEIRGAFDFAVQGAGQWGEIAGLDIRAWGFAGDVGFRAATPWRPRLGASFGYASGDRRAADGTLGTFDVLYPNLGYFTDAPTYYPGNSWDIQPNVTLQPLSTLSWQTGSDFAFRVTNRDAIYEPPGIVLVPATGSGDRFAAILAYTKLTWRPTPRIECVGSFVRAYARDAIEAQGGREQTFWLAQATAKF